MSGHRYCGICETWQKGDKIFKHMLLDHSVNSNQPPISLKNSNYHYVPSWICSCGWASKTPRKFRTHLNHTKRQLFQETYKNRLGEVVTHKSIATFHHCNVYMMGEALPNNVAYSDELFPRWKFTDIINDLNSSETTFFVLQHNKKVYQHLFEIRRDSLRNQKFLQLM